MAYEESKPLTGTFSVLRAEATDKYLVTLNTEDGGKYEFQMLGPVFQAAKIADSFPTREMLERSTVQAPETVVTLTSGGK